MHTSRGRKGLGERESRSEAARHPWERAAAGEAEEGDRRKPPAWTRAQQPPPARQAPGTAAGARWPLARVQDRCVRALGGLTSSPAAGSVGAAPGRPSWAARPEPCGPSSKLSRLSAAGRCTCCPEPCARCPPSRPLLVLEGSKRRESRPDSWAGPRVSNPAAAPWLRVRSGVPSGHPTTGIVPSGMHRAVPVAGEASRGCGTAAPGAL